MIPIPVPVELFCRIVFSLEVSWLGSKRADVVSILHLTLCGLNAKRKYQIGNCCKHEEVYVTVHDSTLNVDLLNKFISINYTAGKYTSCYLTENVTRKQDRKHGRWEKIRLWTAESQSISKCAETKTEEFSRTVEEAVREFDPFAEDDEI